MGENVPRQHYDPAEIERTAQRWVKHMAVFRLWWRLRAVMNHKMAREVFEAIAKEIPEYDVAISFDIEVAADAVLDLFHRWVAAGWQE